MAHQIEDDGLTAFADYPGEQYRPASPEKGDEFIEIWCKACERCRGPSEKPADNCEILAASYTAAGAKEWRIRVGLRTCMAFVPAAKDESKHRTKDMF